MTKEEVIEEFKHRFINSKNNNYIFSESDDFDILKDIPKQCSISTFDSFIDIKWAQNIKIDMA